ncbi:MAG TPA: 6,7-dimethyl-8-ribityllumazine synthase [Verrucomicrobiae bacterium]|jgi:6,7-dimethyl-8-ribityllumazine synthase|nr:6,7-dimethyl-8-ribityllumazine synthase [Verrucomicrobiae bacterium]
MLTPVKRQKTRRSRGSFAIIASQYNAKYVDALVAAAEKELKNSGAKRIRVIRVPGAFEIPAVAARLASARPPFSALICLGVILRGQTSHAQQIADAVSAALAQLQVQHALPVIHEVLLLENEAQAVVRCLDTKHNRGAEAAQTALEMERVMASLPK